MGNSSCLSRFLAGLLLLGLNVTASAERPADEIIKLMPKEIGTFRLAGSIRPNTILAGERLFNSRRTAGDDERASGFAGGEAEYVSADGARLLVEVVRCSRYSDAYSLLTIAAKNLRDAHQSEPIKLTRDIGTASLSVRGRVAFFKGPTFVRVYEMRAAGKDTNTAVTLARLIAEKLDAGEADIPVLVKHLPQWEETQERVVYLAGFSSLKDILPDQPILLAVRSEGDADAVATNYDSSQLVIVEFNTPQMAGDNDRSITARIQELRDQGQPVPTSYRRVGNYSVFVFNAADEQAANALIDQVEYGQVVQWLGDNPNLLEQAQRDYYQTTAGVLVAVVKASGLSLLACLAVGGFFGALLFSRRRAQQRTLDAFSDAGGMLRLNIDEMTPKSDPAKLLGRGH